MKDGAGRGYPGPPVRASARRSSRRAEFPLSPALRPVSSRISTFGSSSRSSNIALKVRPQPMPSTSPSSMMSPMYSPMARPTAVRTLGSHRRPRERWRGECSDGVQQLGELRDHAATVQGVGDNAKLFGLGEQAGDAEPRHAQLLRDLDLRLVFDVVRLADNHHLASRRARRSQADMPGCMRQAWRGSSPLHGVSRLSRRLRSGCSLLLRRLVVDYLVDLLPKGRVGRAVFVLSL